MRILVEFKGLSHEQQLYRKTAADSLPPPPKLPLAVLPPPPNCLL